MGLVTYLLRPWHAHMRAIDLMALWPACCKEAPDGNHDLAKAAFMFHCMHDPAWRVLGEAEIIRRIDALKPPSGASGADRSGQVPCNPGPRPDRSIAGGTP